MAINKNHLFDDLDGVKCAIVEASVTAERRDFLKSLLELNGFTVVVILTPPDKKAAPPPAEIPAENVDPPIEKFTVGVTDVTFNATNAIYGRLLRTKNNRVVTMAYWMQKEDVSNDEIPYFDRGV